MPNTLPRPTDFTPRPGQQQVYVYKRVDAVAAEKAKLKGEWVVTGQSIGGSELPEADWRAIGSKPIVFGDDSVTMGGVTGKYTLRPDKSPMQIDITGASGRVAGDDRPAQGIYQFDGRKLQIHLPRTAAERPRPTDFVHKQDVRTVLLRLERPAPKPEFGTTDPESCQLAGPVSLEGKPATGGRVTVFVTKTQFVGSLIVDGRYAVAGIPAGSHRVVVEAEFDATKRTSEDVVKFDAGKSNGMAFQFKK